MDVGHLGVLVAWKSSYWGSRAFVFWKSSCGPQELLSSVSHHLGSKGFCRLTVVMLGSEGVCRLTVVVLGSKGVCRLASVILGSEGVCRLEVIISGPQGLCRLEVIISGPNGLFVTLTGTDTTLDPSQKADEVGFLLPDSTATYLCGSTLVWAACMCLRRLRRSDTGMMIWCPDPGV